MTTRAARSLDDLRNTLNALCPTRDKASDGGIGDARHKKTNSGHNAKKVSWTKDLIYRARDFDADLRSKTWTMAVWADKLRIFCSSGKTPARFIIFNGRIAGSADFCRDNRRMYPAAKPWQWTAYKGSNKHTMHCHVEADDTPFADKPFNWSPAFVVPKPVPTAPKPAPNPAPAIPMHAGYLTITPEMVRVDKLGDGSGHCIWPKVAEYLTQINQWETPLDASKLIAFNAEPAHKGHPAASTWRGPLAGNTIAYPCCDLYKRKAPTT